MKHFVGIKVLFHLGEITPLFLQGEPQKRNYKYLPREEGSLLLYGIPQRGSSSSGDFKPNAETIEQGRNKNHFHGKEGA